MKKRLSSFLFSFTLLFFVFLILPQSVLAAPSVRVVPNPISAGQGATFIVSGCPSLSQGTVYWDRGVDGDLLDDNAGISTDPSGDARYAHPEFSSGTYTAWVVCGGEESPEPKYEFRSIGGECRILSDFRIEEATTPEPYTNATQFRFAGKLENCSNKSTANFGSGTGANLKAEKFIDEDGNTIEPDGTLQIVEIENTDSEGNFVTSLVSLADTGTWELFLQNLSISGDGKLFGDNSLTVKIGGEADAIQCDTPYGVGQVTECPAECDYYTQFQNDTFICESRETYSIRTGCNFPDVQAERTDKECATDGSTVLTEPAACGENDEGIACAAGSQFCYEGEKTAENLRCEAESDEVLISCSACNDRENYPHFDLRLNACCRLYGCGLPETVRRDLALLSQAGNQEAFEQLAGVYIVSAETETCNQNEVCIQGRGCNPEYPKPDEPPCPADAIDPDTGLCTQVMVGDQRSPILLFTNPTGFIQTLLGFLLSISGMVAIYLILRSGYQIMTSRGNPEAIQEARERLTSAIVGLLFIIFSLVIIQIIGVDILQIPGFGG